MRRNRQSGGAYMTALVVAVLMLSVIGMQWYYVKKGADERGATRQLREMEMPPENPLVKARNLCRRTAREKAGNIRWTDLRYSRSEKGGFTRVDMEYEGTPGFGSSPQTYRIECRVSDSGLLLSFAPR